MMIWRYDMINVGAKSGNCRKCELRSSEVRSSEVRSDEVDNAVIDDRGKLRMQGINEAVV
jgi:C4-type Zn-finger protein